MSADREKNHDMTHGEVTDGGATHATHATHRDIALLLADAADEVEIGIAPYQAVVRGGRRRKARRWAVAVAAALVIAGSTGTLALAGGMGGDGHGVSQVATEPPSGKEWQASGRQVTDLARGVDHGRKWKVTIAVWGAPKDKAEARARLAEMSERDGKPIGVEDASALVGKSWSFVHLTVGDKTSTVIQGQVTKGGNMAGTDIQSYAMPLEAGHPDRAGAPFRLVIGKVAPTAQRVTCTWDDGTTTEALMPAPGTGIVGDFEDLIRPVDGVQPDWFVCLAPDGRSHDKAEVTK